MNESEEEVEKTTSHRQKYEMKTGCCVATFII